MKKDLSLLQWHLTSAWEIIEALDQDIHNVLIEKSPIEPEQLKELANIVDELSKANRDENQS